MDVRNSLETASTADLSCRDDVRVYSAMFVMVQITNVVFFMECTRSLLYFIGFMDTDLKHENEQAWEGKYISEYTFMEKNTHELQDETIFIIFAELKRFFRACEIAAFDEKKRAQYEQDMYDERRFQGQMAASYKNGLEAGIAEGRAEGREAGLTEGLEKGREEERLEMARKMLAEGIPVGVVVKCSGLSAEEISSLG